MRSVSIALLLVTSVREPRDPAWDDRVPAMIVEWRTITTTVFEDCTLAALHESVPETTLVVANQPQSAASEATTTILRTKTVMETESPPSIQTTVTDSIPGYGNATVSVGVDVTSPSRAVTVEGKEEPTEASAAPHLLPTLSQLPQLLPATVAAGLPSLDQVLHPNTPPVPADLDWTAVPENGEFLTTGFGGRSQPRGSEVQYRGNVGDPWGSNIIAVSPTEAHRYQYVVQFTGANPDPWTVIIWNKVGPDGKIDGWYGHSALTFVLAPGETRYVAFDDDSEGAWGAAPGTTGLPTDHWGGYTSTWGEFSFGDGENDGWSGWDVSAIQTQMAHQPVQGMRICQANGQGCSSITRDAKTVVKAYTESNRHHDGIGGAASPGPVRLAVEIDYQQ
ncbi:uncharacterized protein N7459_005462 [Penicillium hispanicum]|uniref:uncharacterized protein n=1 Tax=Penicillium hispanicum TaxID=1080232 RepID=UPI002540106E|nr:uncharacterized protein N7459_005462 [Penicillium hispanicum]KAJ5579477.1 hypothetical protein N7459_005462 [Penicillium hispanicum]